MTKHMNSKQTEIVLCIWMYIESILAKLPGVGREK